MNITSLLSQIDAEIARLKQARDLLSGEATTPKRGRPAKVQAEPVKAKKRKLTPEGRARIAAAVKARWAKQKKSSYLSGLFATYVAVGPAGHR